MSVLRRFTSIALVLLGSVALVVGAMLMWVDSNAFDTDRVVDTTQGVLGNDSVRSLLHRELTTRIVSETDPLYQPVVDAAVTTVLADPRFTAIVSGAVRTAHRTLVDGNAANITFSLAEVWPVVVQELDKIDPTISPQLPDLSKSLDFVLTERSELPRLWTFVDRFHRAAIALLAFGIALIGLALVIGPGRWALLVGLGIGLVAFGLAVQGGIGLAERQVRDRVGDPTARAVADEVTPLFTSPLQRQMTQVMVLGGIVVVVGIGLRLFRPLSRTSGRHPYQPPHGSLDDPDYFDHHFR